MSSTADFKPEDAGDDELALLAEAGETAPAAGSGEIPLASIAPEAGDQTPAAEAPIRLALADIEPEVFSDVPVVPETVTRISTSGGRHFGVSIGIYPSEYEAERALLITALKEVTTLDEALRKVARTKRGFQANYVGMTEDMAQLACNRLMARNVACTTFGPGS